MQLFQGVRLRIAVWRACAKCLKELDQEKSPVLSGTVTTTIQWQTSEGGKTKTFQQVVRSIPEPPTTDAVVRGKGGIDWSEIKEDNRIPKKVARRQISAYEEGMREQQSRDWASRHGHDMGQ